MGGTLGSSKISRCSRCGASWPKTLFKIENGKLVSRTYCTNCNYIEVRTVPLYK
jgi:hypothetical protein